MIAVFWAYLLVVLAAGSAGYLVAAAVDRHACVICHRPLPRVCPDARCGGTPGLGAAPKES